jgi:hypothetical protein
MNRLPALGSTYRGRVLMSAWAQPVLRESTGAKLAGALGAGLSYLAGALDGESTDEEAEAEEAELTAAGAATMKEGKAPNKPHVIRGLPYRGRMPATRLYALKCLLVSGQQLPQLTSIMHAPNNAKNGVLVTCGLYELDFARIVNANGISEWKQVERRSRRVRAL